MGDLISFFKEVFMLKHDDKKVGLSQFKATEPVMKVKKTVKKVENVKLSELMRRSSY